MIESRGPRRERRPPDSWVGAALPVWSLAAAPFACGLVGLLVTWSAVGSIGGLRRGRGGGAGRRLLAHHGLRRLERRPRTIAVYEHVLDTGVGLVMVHQAGELRGGRVFAGHELQVQGRWRGGVLHLRSALDLSTGARLEPEPSPWRRWTLAGLSLLVAELVVGLVVIVLLAG